MASMAKIQLIGNVGRDPEQRYTQNGTMTVTFSVAVNNRRRQADGSQADETEWFRVTTFGKLAEICIQYVTKGKPVYVDGRFRLDKWTDREGNARTTMDVTADTLQLLGGRQDDENQDGGQGYEAPQQRGGGSGYGQQSQPPGGTAANDLDDLPF